MPYKLIAMLYTFNVNSVKVAASSFSGGGSGGAPLLFWSLFSSQNKLVAESALLGARLLLSSDEHLRGIDLARLTIELQNFDLTAPVIATPREIVRKFFQR